MATIACPAFMVLGATASGEPAAPRAAVHMRAVGAPTGFKVRLPSTWSELLAMSSRLLLGGNSTSHVFDNHGDRVVDLDVVGAGDVLYMSSDGAWRPPPGDSGDQTRTSTRREWRQVKSAVKSAVAAEARMLPAASSASGRGTPLSELLLSPKLWATPVERADETPARLCGGRPPYGLLGDPTQLGSGSDANFSKLRGAARSQAHVALCVATAKRMQAANRLSVGHHEPVFPPGATCAIVGSSGSLTRSGHGRAIDAHSVVMRFNLAPAGGEWGADVGNRTTVRILTDKVVAPYMKSAGGKGKGKASLSRFGRVAEPQSTLLLYCMAQGWVGKCMHDQRVSHVNPVFLRYLRSELDVHQGRGRLPSAGLAGMAMAISRCSRVTLYGFGNASDAKANGTGGHAEQCGHYWECKRQQGAYFAGKQGYHDWNAQWRVLSSWIERSKANESTRGRLSFVDGASSKNGIAEGMPW